MSIERAAFWFAKRLGEVLGSGRLPILTFASISILILSGWPQLARSQQKPTPPPKTTLETPLPATSEPAPAAEGVLQLPSLGTDGSGYYPAETNRLTAIALPVALQRLWVLNPQIRQAQQNLDATQFDISGARSGYYPYLQVQSARGKRDMDSSTTLYAIQPIWNGGLTGAEVDKAKASRTAAEANLGLVKLQLGTQMLELYFNVASAQDQLKQSLNYVISLQQLRDSIERRAKAGAAPDADVQTAVALLKQAEATVESVKALRDSSMTQLQSMLLVNPDLVVWPTEPLFDVNELDTIAAQDLKEHPARQDAVSQIDAQEATARADKASLWPEVSVQHREQVSGVKFDPTNSATLLVMGYQTQNSFRGYRTYQADMQRVEALKARLDAVERDIRSTLSVDLSQVRAAGAQMEAQKAATDSTSGLVDSFMRQYEAGRKSWLEVLNALREANDNQMQTIALKRTMKYYEAKLALDSMQWQKVLPESGPGSGAGVQVR